MIFATGWPLFGVVSARFLREGENLGPELSVTKNGQGKIWRESSVLRVSAHRLEDPALLEKRLSSVENRPSSPQVLSPRFPGVLLGFVGNAVLVQLVREAWLE